MHNVLDSLSSHIIKPEIKLLRLINEHPSSDNLRIAPVEHICVNVIKINTDIDMQIVRR